MPDLTRTLIGRAEKDESLPLPVVFHLASWGATRQPLASWMVSELGTARQKWLSG